MSEDSFEKWWDEAHKTGKLVHGLSLKEIFAVAWADAYSVGLRRAAEIADQISDPAEPASIAIQDAIEREAANLEGM